MMFSAVCVWMMVPCRAATPLHLLQQKTSIQESTLTDGTTMGSSEALVFVEALAEKVAGHNYTLSEPEKAAISTIKGFINRILADIVVQRTEDQAEVDGHASLIAGCASTASTDLGQVEDMKSGFRGVGEARTNHTICRNMLVRERRNMTTDCSDYDTYRKTSPNSKPPSCMTSMTAEKVATDDATSKEAMENCLEEIDVWFTPLWDRYVKCRDSKAQVDLRTGWCNIRQRTFETDFCQYSIVLASACDAQTQCRSTHIDARNKSHAAVKISEEARATDCRVGHKVKCLLAIFEETNNTKKPAMLAACHNETHTCPDGIVYPPIPDPTNCTKEPYTPCNDMWLQTEYVSKAWYSTAPTGTCSPCVSTTTTTTTLPLYVFAPRSAASCPDGYTPLMNCSAGLTLEGRRYTNYKGAGCRNEDEPRSGCWIWKANGNIRLSTCGNSRLLSSTSNRDSVCVLTAEQETWSTTTTTTTLPLYVVAPRNAASCPDGYTPLMNCSAGLTIWGVGQYTNYKGAGCSNGDVPRSGCYIWKPNGNIHLSTCGNSRLLSSTPNRDSVCVLE